MHTRANFYRLAVEDDDGTFTVTARQTHTYRIHVAQGLITGAFSDHLRALAEQLEVSQIVLAIDTDAAEHHLGVIGAAVARTGLPLGVVPLPDANPGSLPDSLSSLIRTPQQHRPLLLGVGSGAVSTTVRTVAARQLPGVPYALVPTTVQAQIDAGTDSKVDVGHTPGQLNGAFPHMHPAAVYIDPALTSALPPRDVRAGLAEAIKLALIINPLLVYTLERSARPLPAGPALAAIVEQAVASKLMLLALESEKRLLDLGHRVADPYRAATGYRIPQGEAVAAGIAVAATHAFLSGKTTLKHRDRILNLLAAYQLPVTIPDAMRQPVWEGIAAGHHTRHGSLPLVIPQRPGQCTLTDDFDRWAFDKALDDLAARP
ncbi:iron-containing alcohol dehydrogenase [Streptomyces rubradiris]|uniref:3-dehydroquinate synthase family protein n=1 Tax=Streptomyces rubradiris TaxID=285531 RepID=UPI0036E51F9E